MSAPVVRFCEFVVGLPKRQTEEVTALACVALGRVAKPTGASYSEHRPIGHMFHSYTVDDLREHMTILVEQLKMQEYFLIPSLFHFLIDHFQRIADPEATSKSIDFHLGNVEFLKDQLQKTRDDREDHLDDATLKSYLKDAEDILSSKPAQRLESEETAQRLQQGWDQLFSRDYWMKWGQERLRKSWGK